MSKFWKYTLLLMLADVLLAAATFVADTFYGPLITILIGQLVVGVLFCFDPEKRVWGQAMLAAFGILMTIGLSLCTLLLVNA